MLTAVMRNTNKANKQRVGLKRILSASLVAILSYSAVTHAAQRVVVNEAQVQVEDQTQRTQQTALKKALKQVFIKMSGSTSVLDNAGVRAALTSPQSLLRSYRFAFDKNRTYYIAEFDQAKLNEILQRELLPLWGDRRPETIVWLAQEDESATRTILDESLDTELQQALKQTAKERGVPLSLPLMDLTDSVNISTYDVWGRFVEPLRKASMRYSVDNIIGARVYRNDPNAIPELPENIVPSGTVESLDNVLDDEAQARRQYDQSTDSTNAETNSLLGSGEGPINENDAVTGQPSGNGEKPLPVEQIENTTVPFTMNEFANYAKRADEGDFALDWVFIGGGKVSYGSIYGDSPEALGNQLVDAYSNYLSSLYAVVGIEESEREVIKISIANVGTIASYASATDYLNSLSVIENATLVEQSGTVATYSLTLVGTVDDLLNSVKLENKLRPVTDAYGQTVNGNSFYWSN
ncbi:DUF2066 domain-containing protein [Alteromonas sp. BL110]|uniref:DUF2066 domain-containing protein n=1 Tax=Alteromonas sp. BL110 TaxID=1714845 RepID=UPI000E4F7E7F|nr:DUF2066 domain-containing protein [Alteromonas sp. BL110]AXT40856.1 DUF2066 domain-containing protein [Alteromonas sp. BL110]RKM81010.1 DUF2066 domain-containing protein [Alteromonas sp. BL110]